METFLRRLLEMVLELREHPRTQLLAFQTFDPIAETAVKRVEQFLGHNLDPAVAAFYRQTDGLQLRWIDVFNPDFNPQIHGLSGQVLDFASATEDYLVDDGSIMILPLEEVFLSGSPRTAVGAENMTRVVSFDLFDKFSDMAFVVDESREMTILMGSQHHTEYNRSRPTDFQSYLEFLLTTRGAVVERPRTFGKSIDEIATPYSQPARELALETLLTGLYFEECQLDYSTPHGIDRDLIHNITNFANPIDEDEWFEILEEHRPFAEELVQLGDIGMIWEIIQVSGIVIGAYIGPRIDAGKQARLNNRNLQHLDLRRIYLPFANLVGAHAVDQRFDGSILRSIIATDGRFDGSSFDDCDLRGSSFSRSSLDGSSFCRANLDDVCFDGCSLKNCDFTEASMDTTTFRGANLEGYRI
jgi:hypothetical protein